MIYKRNRFLYVIMIFFLIALGLGSRRFSSMLPDFLNTYLGDSLWAVMIFFGVGFIFRNVATNIAALLGVSFCYLIEVSQLYHAEWIDEIRRTTIGGLVLGYGFLWTDLIAYTVGIGIGVIIEIFIMKIYFKIEY